MWKTLQAVRSLEAKIGELYRCYAEVYKDDVEAANLFNRLARDEEKHCGIIDFEIRLIIKDHKMPDAVETTAERVALEQAKVGDLLKCTGLPLSEAVANCFRLEQTAAEAYYSTAVVDQFPDLMGLIKRLGAGDKAHFQALAKFAAARGFAPAPAWDFDQAL